MSTPFIKASLLFLFVVIWNNSLCQTQKTKKTRPFELGIHFGNFTVAGDVHHKIFPGYAAGFHLRKSITSAFSMRTNAFYGSTYGLHTAPSGQELTNEESLFDGYSEQNPWFYAYKASMLRLNIQGVIELTNLGKSFILKNYNIYVYGGVGINSPGTKINLRDDQGQLYTNLIDQTSFGQDNDFDTTEGRKAIRNALKNTYDDSYETSGPKERGLFRLGNETNIFPELNLGIGVSRKISKKFNVSLDYELMISDNDYLDGRSWTTGTSQSGDNDLVSYLSLRISMNISKNKNNPEPIFWKNPWDEEQNKTDSLAHIVDSLIQNFQDDDGDGIFNIMDLQPNSRKSCLVDTRGRTLDSDNDGIVDCDDPYPYNADHTAKQSKEISDVKMHINNLDSLMKVWMSKNESSIPTYDLKDHTHFVYFESNSAHLDFTNLKSLVDLVSLINQYDVTCIKLLGHADQFGSERFNKALGKRRAENTANTLKELFNVQNVNINISSVGEASPQVVTPSNENEHALNRRVEIRICD